MVYRCSVLGCLRISTDGVGLHKFPLHNQTLLPLWIMATHRTNWLPNVTSRICDNHFNVDDYEDGNENNLTPKACPLLNDPSISAGNDIVMPIVESNDSVVTSFSTNNINSSKLNTNNVLNRQKYSQMEISDEDSIISISSDDSNSNETDIINNDMGRLMNVRNTNIPVNTMPLYLTVTSHENNVENNMVMAESNDSVDEFASTGEINFSDLNTDALLNTINYNDMNFSDDDSIISISSDDSNSKEPKQTNNDKEESINVTHTNIVANTVPLCSTVTSLENNVGTDIVNADLNDPIAELFSTSHVDFSDLNTDDLLNTLNNIDMEFSQDNSINILSEDSNSKESKRTNNEGQPTNVKNINHVDNTMPLYSNVTGLENSVENNMVMAESNDSVAEFASTGEINFSDLNTEDLLNTINYNDMNFSDDDSIISISSDDSNSKESKQTNNDKEKSINVKRTNIVANTVPACSKLTIHKNVHWSTNCKCAVVFCNHKFRLLFDDLFFINFPKNKHLCSTWWKKCGRKEPFDPSFKICSIHFNSNNFSTITVNQFNRSCQNTVLKNNNIGPTQYLLRHEFTQYLRKQKIIFDNNSSTKIQTLPPEIVKSFFLNHNKTSLQKHATPIVKAGTSNGPSLSTKRGINLLEDSSGEGKQSNFERVHGNVLVVKKRVGEKTTSNDESKNLTVENKSNKRNLKNKDSNVNPIKKQISSTGRKRPRMQLSKKDHFEEVKIPKSKNNGSDSDYIYLDTLNGDDVGNYLSIEKTYKTTKSSKSILPELLEKNKISRGIPKKIINNLSLRECYSDMLPAVCDTDCGFLCYYALPDPQRKQIYNKFKMIYSITEQNCLITQLVKLRVVKRSDETLKSCPLYHLEINNFTIKVCQTFFINTLGITKHRLDGILNPINYSWFSNRDRALKAIIPNQLIVIYNK